MKIPHIKYSETAEMTPFDSPEEAWLWCCLCESLETGKSRSGYRKIIRPCESSDIIIAVKRLIQNGIISQEQAKILSKYGKEQTPPHPHFGDSLRVCKLWKDALQFLGNTLKQKGIVA